MSGTEGHWCGPKACPRCGEVHGCICGNDCLTPALRDLLPERSPAFRAGLASEVREAIAPGASPAEVPACLHNVFRYTGSVTSERIEECTFCGAPYPSEAKP